MLYYSYISQYWNWKFNKKHNINPYYDKGRWKLPIIKMTTIHISILANKCQIIKTANAYKWLWKWFDNINWYSKEEREEIDDYKLYEMFDAMWRFKFIIFMLYYFVIYAEIICINIVHESIPRTSSNLSIILYAEFIVSFRARNFIKLLTEQVCMLTDECSR